MANTQRLIVNGNVPPTSSPREGERSSWSFSFGQRVEVMAPQVGALSVARGNLRLLARGADGAEATLCVLGPSEQVPSEVLHGTLPGVFARASRHGVTLEATPASPGGRALAEWLAVTVQLCANRPELALCSASLLKLLRRATRFTIAAGGRLRGLDAPGSLCVLGRGVVGYASAGEATPLPLLHFLPDSSVELVAREPAVIFVCSSFAVDAGRREDPALDRYLVRVAAQSSDNVPRPSLALSDAMASEAASATARAPLTQAKPARRRAAVRAGRVRFVAQIDESDCGVACLTMVARYHGASLELATARALTKTSRDGLGLQSLCAAARALGLVAIPLKVSRGNLGRLTLPAILHWDEKHWVVLVRHGSRPIIADPARGLVRLSPAELERRWDGYAAEVQAGSARDIDVGRSRQRLFVPQLRAHALSLLVVGLLAVGGALLSVVLPLLSQVVVDQVVVGGASSSLVGILAASGAVFVVVLAAQAVQRYVTAQVAARIDAALVSRLADHLLSLPFEYFLSRRNGDIQRRLRSAQELRAFLVNKGLEAVLAVANLVFAVTAVAFYARSLLLIYLVGLPLYGLALVAAWRAIRPVLKKAEEAHAKHESEQYEIVAGIVSVKSADAESYAHKRVVRAFSDVARAQFRGEVLTCVYESFVRLLGFALTTAVLWQSVRLVVDGTLSLGGLVALLGLSPMIGGPLLQLLSIWDEAQRVRILRDRISDVIDHPSDARSGTPRAHYELAGKIALVGVAYRYPGRQAQAAVQDVQMEVLPGEKLALVGESGCGKSTLAKVMAGLLPCSEGRVAFDDLDAKRLHPAAIRRKILLVPQVSEMVPGSVLENIALESEPDWARAVEAAKVAEAHDFIERLPDGYHTHLGSGQGNLSGGQLQRLALARAVYRAPAVLILDEATSALDARTEALVRRNLLAHFARSTVIVVAHRLSTIRDVGRIVVLDGGRVVETGSHQALTDKRGLYFDLMHRQVS